MKKTLTLTLLLSNMSRMASTLTLTFLACFLLTSCDKDESDAPEILCNTEWYPVRYVGTYNNGTENVPYEMELDANGTGTLYYEVNGEQKTWTHTFPGYKFFMKNGKNVFIWVDNSQRDSKPKQYKISGDYIFFEMFGLSSSSPADSSTSFITKYLQIISADSIRIEDTFYKKR